MHLTPITTCIDLTRTFDSLISSTETVQIPLELDALPACRTAANQCVQSLLYASHLKSYVMQLIMHSPRGAYY